MGHFQNDDIWSLQEWNLDLTKCQGTGEICSFISRVRYIEHLDLTNFQKNNQNVR